MSLSFFFSSSLVLSLYIYCLEFPFRSRPLFIRIYFQMFSSLYLCISSCTCMCGTVKWCSLLWSSPLIFRSCQLLSGLYLYLFSLLLSQLISLLFAYVIHCHRSSKRQGHIHIAEKDSKAKWWEYNALALLHIYIYIFPYASIHLLFVSSSSLFLHCFFLRVFFKSL